MKFSRYQEYKDSAVQWLNQIPQHWQVEPLKHHLERNDGGVWGDDPDGVNDTIVLRSTDQTVDGRWRLDESARRRLSVAEINYCALGEGDLVVTKSSGSSLHIGKTTLVTPEIASRRCCYSNFMQRLRTKPSLSPRFAWYVLNNDFARTQFDLFSNSTTGLANLNAAVIGRVLVPIPPLPEQAAIIVFLDEQTIKIDALIAEQNQIMALLREKRQAVISHAVTKGLNPDAPTKPSGIDWLGDIPRHWNVMPVKRDLAFLTSGSRGWAENYSDDGALFIRIANLTRESFQLDLEDTQRVAVPAGSEEARTKVKIGDVLFSITAFLGSVAVVPEGLETAYVSQHIALARLRQSRLTPKWVGFVALSAVGKAWLERQGYGGTKIQLGLNDVGGLLIPVPPVSEQAKIVRHLEGEVDALKRLGAEAQHAIELLQERRTALISAAVTGQIDVRQLADAQPA